MSDELRKKLEEYESGFELYVKATMELQDLYREKPLMLEDLATLCKKAVEEIKKYRKMDLNLQKNSFEKDLKEELSKLNCVEYKKYWVEEAAYRVVVTASSLDLPFEQGGVLEIEERLREKYNTYVEIRVTLVRD